MVGGATVSIGDPSGKSLERPELDLETLERNSVGITKTIRGILGKGGGVVGGCGGFVALNNYDWLTAGFLGDGCDSWDHDGKRDCEEEIGV